MLRKKQPEPVTQRQFQVTEWITAIATIFGTVALLLGGILRLDGRIGRLETQNSVIQEDLKGIRQSIEENAFPRREAELQNRMLDQRIEAVSDRVRNLEK